MGFQVQAQVQDQEQMKGKVSHFKIPATNQQINESTNQPFPNSTFLPPNNPACSQQAGAVL
jgi:hypothetical protein